MGLGMFIPLGRFSEMSCCLLWDPLVLCELWDVLQDKLVPEYVQMKMVFIICFLGWSGYGS